MIKTPAQLAVMREAGRLLAQVFDMLDGFVAAGRSTLELDSAVEAFIRNDLKARPASLGQYDYPFCINTSINEVVCHGMPSAKQFLKDGDIINIDVAVTTPEGWIGDTSRMYYVGQVSNQARRLVETTYEALLAGIRAVKPGATLGDIGYAIQSVAQRERFSVVREYCGHGIGKVYHDEPQVLHYGSPGQGMVLQPGMIFTIEPMLNAGKAGTRELSDGWTVITQDKSLSAQWEHMVVVTETGYEVLTQWPDGTGERAAI